MPVLDIKFALEIAPNLLSALIVTAKITCISSIVALFFGTVLYCCQLTSYKIINFSTREMLQFIRSTPMLVQVYFFYFSLPSLGIDMQPLLAGSLVLGVHYSPYICEVYRSASKSVAQGQREAGSALGLRGMRLYRLVILPQMMPQLVPGVGNALIALIKDTPVLSAISVMELLATTKEIGTESFRYLEPMTMCGIIYLLLLYILSVCIAGARARYKWISPQR